MDRAKDYEYALYGVGQRVRGILESIPQKIKENTQEIRLRVGSPLAITLSGDTIFLKESGETSFLITDGLYYVTEKDVEESFINLTQNSVYAHEEELKNGFIIMKNGGRAGVCGTFSKEGFLSDVTSVNIRIAHQVFGCANEILKGYSGGGLLIAGAAGCGKTTVLRDMVRQLSLGRNGKFHRICVIDSRGEISGHIGAKRNDLGRCTDVLYIDDKAKGMEIALRTMFPEIIAFDEIANAEELNKVKESFFSGVDIITTAHIGSKEELLKRSVTYELVKDRIISYVALLPRIYGGEAELFSVSQLL